MILLHSAGSTPIPYSTIITMINLAILVAAVLYVFGMFIKNIQTAEQLRTDLKVRAGEAAKALTDHEEIAAREKMSSKMQFLWHVTTHKLLLANFGILCLIAALLATRL